MTKRREFFPTISHPTQCVIRGNYRTCCLACFKAVFSALSAGERRGSDCESGYSHTTPSSSASRMYW